MSRVLPFVAFVAFGGVLGAQQRPDFSGEWVSIDDRATSVAATGDAAFRRGNMGTGWATTMRITQQADSLILSYVFFSTYDLQPPLRFAYAMDGAESRNSVMIGHAESVQRSTLSWQGSVLVIVTKHPLPKTVGSRAGFAEVRQSLTLESPTSLVVETTRLGVDGAPTTSTTASYSKR